MMMNERHPLVTQFLQVQAVAAGQQEALAALGRMCDRLRAEAIVQERQSSEAIRHLTAELVTRDQALTELRGTLVALQGEIARIHASKAWRVMAPARWLRAKLMGPRGGGA